jgi:putative ABC transport system permease protein
MRKWFYTRLAWTNIRSNAQTYWPYILACSATVMMFYNMLYLLYSREIRSLADSQAISYVLFLGSIVTGVFSIILMLYINSFLIKRRKKEFGLFNVLGMEKKHIARILSIETVLVGMACIVLGLVAGVVFSKLALLLLLNILALDAAFGFEIPVRAVAITALMFGAAFLINLIYNVWQVHASKPVELLKGGNVGEKEPRTKWLMALTGAAALGGGYWIALTTKTPLAALNLFFVAVLLVIIGTYSLFTAGSIAILKALRRNKRFYYRTNPFIAVSGMIYRMKQHAAGLSSICILSTAVIIMLSSTVCLYAGMEDILGKRFARDISVTLYKPSDETIRDVEAIVNEEAARAGIIPGNILRFHHGSTVALQEGSSFRSARSENFSFASSRFAALTFITAEEYNRLENAGIEVREGEAYVYVFKGELPGDTLDLEGVSLRIAGRLDSFGLSRGLESLTNHYVIVTAGEREIILALGALNKEDASPSLDYEYHFDTLDNRDAQIQLVSALRERLRNHPAASYVTGREAERHGFLTVYGGLFFLGLFLGSLFILGTVLIIYYKQISEGYDDKGRYAIMRKVGLTDAEIRRAIRYQVLLVFFLPLVMAVIHIAAAFPVISKLLVLFNMTNIPLFALCTALTILVFAACYALIYGLTARTYYRIVR